jgi:Double-GTPase 1
VANSDHSHLMIGLPGTGKSTFLAALWHVIRNHDAVPGALRLAGVRGDRTYLNRIEQQWLACLPIERTSVSGQAVTIRIEHPTSRRAIDLSIPDISGEMYEVVQWGQRECPVDYADLAKSSSGALLFLHPDATIETDSIVQVDQAISGLFDGPSDALGTGTERPEPWDPRRTPTQVKLVELLQFFLSHARHRIRLGVVISAWDRVTEQPTTPDAWLRKCVPLLHQFLLANDDRIEHRVYGVSAQGGPLEAADSLREHSVAVRRIRVVDSEGEGNDITSPVKWLMTSEQGEP